MTRKQPRMLLSLSMIPHKLPLACVYSPSVSPCSYIRRAHAQETLGHEEVPRPEATMIGLRGKESWGSGLMSAAACLAGSAVAGLACLAAALFAYWNGQGPDRTLWCLFEGRCSDSVANTIYLRLYYVPIEKYLAESMVMLHVAKPSDRPAKHTFRSCRVFHVLGASRVRCLQRDGDRCWRRRGKQVSDQLCCRRYRLLTLPSASAFRFRFFLFQLSRGPLGRLTPCASAYTPFCVLRMTFHQQQPYCLTGNI